jgi:hypothetical protein
MAVIYRRQSQDRTGEGASARTLSGASSWDGSQFRNTEVRVWDGSTWRLCEVRAWDGSQWRLTA